MTSPSDSYLSPGTRLAHYEVRRPVGQGAMGTVYEAYDTGLDRMVAVKVLRPEISESDETVTRFTREARAAAKVNHPNLTHIYFVGVDDGRHYFAMEFLPGQTLEECIREFGPTPLEGAVDILIQSCRGLAAAHGVGVIHRDVKPSNIQLLPDGTVKLTDFGLAKSLSGEVDVTGAGRIVGTPRFMSPEQLRGEEIDWRTDLYALGLVGWYLLAGKPPFEGENLGKIISDQMGSPLPPLMAPRPDLRPPVQRVLERFCAKDPADRPESMAEAIRLLESLHARYLDLAPLASRGAALMTDVIVWWFGYAAIMFGVQAVLGIGSGIPVREWVAGLVGVLVGLVTQVAMEFRFRASIGKLLFNLRVVRDDGSRPRLPVILARYVIRFPFQLAVIPIPIAVAGGLYMQAASLLAGMICYLAARRRTVSDLLTRTRVIYRRSTEHREQITDD